MSYSGSHRFLTTNVLATSTLTCSATRPGLVSGVQKRGLGSATMSVQGSYTGDFAQLYTIEITSIENGAEVGQAVYHWRTADTLANTWEVSNIVTHDAFATLSAGLSIAFTTGAGADFAVGDAFQFFAYPFWSLAHLYDWRPDTQFVMQPVATKLFAIDCGVPTRIQAFILEQHNTNPTAQIVLRGNPTNAFTSPAYQLSLTPSTPCVAYLDQTYRYWQIQNTDTALVPWNIGACYLGPYVEPPYNAQRGATLTTNVAIRETKSPSNLAYQVALAQQREYTLQYAALTDEELAWFYALFQQQFDLDTGIITPCWFHFHSDHLDTLKMMRWHPEFAQVRNGPNINQLSITLQEI